MFGTNRSGVTMTTRDTRIEGRDGGEQMRATIAERASPRSTPMKQDQHRHTQRRRQDSTDRLNRPPPITR